MRPEVWAPRATAVELVLGHGERHRLEPAEGGWFRGGPELPAGTRYGFSLDGADPLPDPRTRWQPDGVHGLSAVDDPTGHAWGDQLWTGVDLRGGITYELHVGTFTPEGTLDSAVDRLGHLVELGIDAVELLPLAEAMGERGWGYDGVHLWAVHHAYGGPAALRRFVDAAHQLGLGVLLDVVYNHLGPEGASLDRFGPYFTDDHQTPWGNGLNLEGRDAQEVRRFVVDNAVHWCLDHHIDGLRLDAVHALVDDSPVHLVAELTAAVHGLEARDGRRRWVVVEDERTDLGPLQPIEEGGWDVDGRWGDELHHALHAHLTGERDGYYAPFGRLAQVAEVLERGQLPPAPQLLPAVALDRFVVCSQNHDQVGNRPRGERLEHLVGRDRAMGAAAVVLLGPGTPLLLQGEEWAATSPFPFFCDTEDEDLAERIRSGRAAELAPLGWSPDDYVDPLSPEAVAAARLDWSELDEPAHREVLTWYRTLVALRRIVVASVDRNEVVAHADEDAGLLLVDRGPLRIAVVTGSAEAEVALGTREVLATWGATSVSGSLATLGPGATLVAGPPEWASS